jgi:hypothetical protein
VGSEHKRKPIIDVMENVFGGVHITTEKEPRARSKEPDLRGRPWLTGVEMSEVQVTLEKKEDDE